MVPVGGMDAVLPPGVWIESDGHRSFSWRMRLDVSIGRGDVDDLGSLIVLDAKLGVEDGLSEVLNSIHTYPTYPVALDREA